MKTIHIWHTNDVHSEFTHFSRVVTYLKENRNPVSDLTLDAGDYCDAKSIIISGSNGNAGIRFLVKAGYDALAIGNNEFFLGIEKLQNLDDQNIKLLSCNLTDLEGKRIANLCPYTIFVKDGVRILVIGSSPFFSRMNEFTNMAGVITYDPKPMIREILNEQEGKYDVCIFLSHLGYKSDVKTAEEIAGIDLIIGGHSHSLLETIELVNGTWIAQAGNYAEFLGRITLEIDADKVSVKGEMIDLKDVKQDEEFLCLMNEEEEKAIACLSVVQYQLDEDYAFDFFAECDAMNLLCDILWNRYGGDFALMHHGILEGTIHRDVSKYALLKLCPSPLNPTMLKWKGKQIREALQLSRDENLIHQSGRGSGFRGKVLGTIAVSHNVEVTADHILINGKELEDEHLYTVISDDYLQRGGGYESGYPCLKVREEDCTYYDGFIRDLLETELMKKESSEFVKKRRRFDIQVL